jgi:uncharacterized protein (TIGR01244 family)
MNFTREITPGITIADQPTEADLRALKTEGYVGVVNLRNDSEPEQPLSTSAEGEKVRALGMDYVHYGVGGVPLTDAGVDSVCNFLDAHAGGKVLVHCRKGARAAALVLIHQARREGWGSDEALENGSAQGLTVEGGLRTMVSAYLQEHPAGS